MDPSEQTDFHALRQCIRAPIPEIFEAARLLNLAVDAHLLGDIGPAEALLKAADMPEVRAWVAPLLGSEKSYPDRAGYVRFRPIEDAAPILPKPKRLPVRMPSAEQKAALITRFGHQCVFCGIPVIRAEVRLALAKIYPRTVLWEGPNERCHAAFLCMWLQYDHVLPHSRGGDNNLDNVVVTCSGCNYGRMSHTLEEVGLIDPRTREVARTSWDGLERLFARA